MNPCEQNQADCDSTDECQTGLACGLDNCAGSLGFEPGVDCCCCCNHNPDCDAYASAGYCTYPGYIETMAELCGKSCNYCTESSLCDCPNLDSALKKCNI